MFIAPSALKNPITKEKKCRQYYNHRSAENPKCNNNYSHSTYI